MSLAVCCSVLQCVAVCCSACCKAYPSLTVCPLIHEFGSVLQCVAVCCSALQCVAVRCRVLQGAAVRCSVLQRTLSTHCFLLWVSPDSLSLSAAYTLACSLFFPLFLSSCVSFCLTQKSRSQKNREQKRERERKRRWVCVSSEGEKKHAHPSLKKKKKRDGCVWVVKEKQIHYSHTPIS